jgi:CpeT/CpcT family (DUF1001)
VFFKNSSYEIQFSVMLSLKGRKNLTGFGIIYIIEPSSKKLVRFSQLIFNLTLVFLFLFVSFYSFAQKNKPVVLKEDMQQMLLLFEGEFDNFQQVYKEKEDKVKDIHEHIHSTFKKVNFAALGNNVFYVIQYMDGDTSKVYRQRMYAFAEDKKENAIRLDIYTFKTDSLFYFSNVHPEKLDKLTMDDLNGVTGCSVFWKRNGENFIGYMPPNECNFISKRSGKKIYATDSLLLNKDIIWIRDEAFDSVGNRIYGREDKVHHKLKRCHFYKGWILLEKAGLKEEYHSMKNLVWHDQGKRQLLYLEDGKASKYEVELAAVVYGKDLEVLKIAVYETGVSKAIAYAWATPGAKNIGINMRWIQAGLTLIK